MNLAYVKLTEMQNLIYASINIKYAKLKALAVGYGTSIKVVQKMLTVDWPTGQTTGP